MSARILLIICGLHLFWAVHEVQAQAQSLTNAAAEVARAPEWRLSAAPSVRIGVVDGAPEYTLHRVVSARILADGRIAALNAGTQLRFYSSTGRHLATLGRAGDGPGEFRQLQSLSVWQGDSLLLFDNGLLRASIHDEEGRFGRSFQLVARDAAALANGAIIALLGGDPPLTTTHQRTAAVLDLVRVASDGTITDTISRVAGVAVEGTRARFMPVRFGPAPFFAAGGDRIYLGNSGSYEIHVFDQRGQPVRRIRTELPAQPVSDRYRTESVRTGSEGSVAVAYAESFPEYSALLVDRPGNLWVRRYPKPEDDRVDWHVYAPDGRIRGRLVLPVTLMITDAGDDYVLGVYRDDMDVEFIVKFTLLKR